MIQVQNHNQCKTLISISYEMFSTSLVRVVNNLTLHWLYGYEIYCLKCNTKESKTQCNLVITEHWLIGFLCFL